ncbi:malate dehydrogenase [candidate division KSB1 bacterium]|nr:MAG: malate dehydrogenase [candidate division KSB1 bacterium]
MAEKRLTKEELLTKAYKPAEIAMQLHPFYKGKIEIIPKCVIRNFQDFGIWYTPGVAEPCKDINKNPEAVYKHTNKGNMVAVVTDGTRVLGLGDIGPEAGLPVMEGKALLFKYLGGVDAFPICLDTKDPDEIINTVLILQPSFGGVNLEDIAKPKCFRILRELRKKARIPVWHDDQQGTACITLAGAINALKVVGKPLDNVKITMIGAGASNICITNILIKAGANPGKIIMVDSKGTLHIGRTELKEKEPEKWELCEKTNEEQVIGGMKEAIKGADMLIALSRSGPDVIKKEWVASMSKDAIVFVCANPIPEMWPWEAKEAGARIVATGRSDFPNQINNSLGFPGIFRGTLDIRAKTITDEMAIAAAYELAKCAEDKGLNENYLVPTMEEWEVYPRVATAVALKAQEQGITLLKKSRDELLNEASTIIKKARDEIHYMMKEGFIKPAPENTLLEE